MVAWHVTAIVCTVFVVLYVDEQGLRWFRGRTPVLNRKSIDILHALVSVGIAGIILTGGLMFVDRSSYLLSQSVFLVKMGFVAALLVNAFSIGSLSRLASEKSFVDLTPSERMKVFLSGAVSIVGWLGAITCGIILSEF